jgi:hypothetical protein
MKPTVGRVVHYTNLGDKDGRYPPEQQAAVITKVHDDDSVSLFIIYATGTFFMERVPRSDAYERGHWTWPPRVESA